MKLIGGQTEKDLLAWANKISGKDPVKSFKDKSLKTGKWLIELCAGIEPRAVNWDIVTDGETEEDIENNCKYAISIARKLGAIVFCVWDDIKKVNFKMILVFVCALHTSWEDINEKKKKKKVAGEEEGAEEEVKDAADGE